MSPLTQKKLLNLKNEMSEYLNITIFQNTSACLYVNEAYDVMVDFKNKTIRAHENPSGLGFSSAILLFSVVTLFVGARFIRPLATIIAAFSSFLVVFKVTQTSNGFTCDSSLILSGVISLIVAILTISLMNCAIFMIGAVALSGITHLIFVAIPQLHEIGNLPVILGNSVIYWSSILIVGVAGGIFLKRYKTLALEAITSLLGGIGMAYSLHTITEYTNTNIHKATFVGIAIASSTVGFFVQRQLRLRKKRKKKRIKSQSVDD